MGGQGETPPGRGFEGAEPLASSNVLHWVGWLPGTTRCGAGLAVPASPGAAACRTRGGDSHPYDGTALAPGGGNYPPIPLRPRPAALTASQNGFRRCAIPFACSFLRASFDSNSSPPREGFFRFNSSSF